MTCVALAIEKVRLDGGTQSRAALNDEVVAEYAQRVRDGEDFPPITVFFDGSHYWLADGFHRFHAYRAAGASEIEIEARPGTKRDAVLFSVGANTKHGLRRTNDDKRRAVMTLLNDAEWSKWSDREIAKQCGVSREYVNRLRPVTCDPITSEERTFTTKHGTVATMDTAKIGKAPEPGQAENDAIRGATRAALSPAVQAIEAAKAERRAEAKASWMVAPGGPELLAEIAELREANAALDADLAAAKAEIKLFGEMRVQWEQGGFENVIAGKDEEIRVLLTRVERESGDKVKWMNVARFWEKEAKARGYSRDAVIDVDTGEVSNG